MKRLPISPPVLVTLNEDGSVTFELDLRNVAAHLVHVGASEDLATYVHQEVASATARVTTFENQTATFTI